MTYEQISPDLRRRLVSFVAGFEAIRNGDVETAFELSKFYAEYCWLCDQGVNFHGMFRDRLEELNRLIATAQVGDVVFDVWYDDSIDRAPGVPDHEFGGAMRFTIAARTFRVFISGWPLLLDGVPCLAKLDRTNHRILIAGELPRHDRRRELFHELRHCWIDAFGVPDGIEPDANTTGTMFDVLLPQYLDQGGDERLLALEPPPSLALPRECRRRMRRSA
jgi:hypothetical protein